MVWSVADFNIFTPGVHPQNTNLVRRSGHSNGNSGFFSFFGIQDQLLGPTCGKSQTL